MKYQLLVRHARLARISSWRRRSCQATPRPVEDNVFGPNLNQVKRQPVPSPVASPCRRRVDARRWRKTTSWDAGCRPRVRLGHNHFQGQRNNNPKKELLDKVTFGFVVGLFFSPRSPTARTPNVSWHRTGHPPAGFPGVQTLQRLWSRPAAG